MIFRDYDGAADGPGVSAGVLYKIRGMPKPNEWETTSMHWRAFKSGASRVTFYYGFEYGLTEEQCKEIVAGLVQMLRTMGEME